MSPQELVNHRFDWEDVPGIPTAAVPWRDDNAGKRLWKALTAEFDLHPEYGYALDAETDEFLSELAQTLMTPAERAEAYREEMAAIDASIGAGNLDGHELRDARIARRTGEL